MSHPASSERTRIKICGLTREHDVDAAVDAGADAVGFVMYAKSRRYVTVQRAAELARRLPPFVTPVLLFVNEAPEVVQQACTQVPGSIVQFHGDETPQQCHAATDNGRLAYIRAARIPLDDSPFDLVRFAADFAAAKGILLDAHVDGFGGSGKTFNWSRLSANVQPGPAEHAALRHLVLSGGLSPANVGDGIAQVRPRCKTLAVDVSSGVELDGPGNQGIKDPEKINRFVAAVRAADVLLAKSTHGLRSPNLSTT
ncbi:phosphoribosylanthranilate isomerase [Caenimonas koreensis DSM 17982]|uniref:N-(5'-phosphoribosyl)anthranilate isomerase n=1 Tax=Caenimonas koreensis DSM 17982 TaxID=1121255 RepID=A0A844B8D8_9BURK|nr:phosphoribosylanthranilate isomerase [Caenimonas koreensis]MRD47757.1 phosphoribosylanthranilate isomerase [Caenimonas koreensis DSM 17982]